MEEVDSKPHGWLLGIQKLGLEVEPGDETEFLQSHDTTLKWEISSYRWTKKLDSWDEIYLWWICHEDW